MAMMIIMLYPTGLTYALVPTTGIQLNASSYRSGEIPELLIQFDAESRTHRGATLSMRVTHETGGELYTTKEYQAFVHDTVVTLPISPSTRGLHFVLLQITYDDGLVETYRTFYTVTPNPLYTYGALSVALLVGGVLIVFGRRKRSAVPILLTQLR